MVLKVTHVGSDVPLDVAKPLILARIMSRVAVGATGCWVWQGWCNTLGYGEGNFCGRRWMVHRLVYTLERGEIAPGLQACHTCDNPKCVNPDHIFIGTRKDNMSDCRQKGRHFLASKTHCKRGHEFTTENTRVNRSGSRTCRTCERERQRTKKYTPGRGRQLKAACIHGHPLIGENVVITADGRRRCRACNLAQSRRTAQRRAGSGPAVSAEPANSA